MFKEIRKSCTPAYIYFIISLISIILIGFQNIGNVKNYCVGKFECEVTSTIGVFIIKMIYVLFWTWMLNVFCRAGYKNIAWFILLLPFITMFIFIAALLLHR